MRRLLCNFISVMYSFFRFLFMKLIHFADFKYYPVERVSPNVVIEINRGGKLILKKKVRIHSGTKIKVRHSAKLEIGNGVKINYNCIFVSKEQITIEDGVEFGPGVLVYDHDHDFRLGLKNNHWKAKPIIIGKNSWIGANTVILKGTKIGENCVIGAGSVVTGIIPDNSLYIQKREVEIKQYEIDGK